MNSRLVKNTVIVLGCSVIAKVFSYIWEAVLAAYLGATEQADAFYMTTSIYTILYPVLDLGIWKVFLPIYKENMIRDKEHADSFANLSLTFFGMISVGLVLFLIVFARPLTILVAPGFAGNKQIATIHYLRIAAPTYLLMASSSVIGAMLQCHDRFLGSQIRELGTHVSKIVYVLIFYRQFGIFAAVTAMIVGSFFRFLIQLPFIDWNWKFRWNFHFRAPQMIPMLKGLPSVALTAAVQNLHGLVDKILASGAPDGAVSCLNYGNKLISAFSGMFSIAIGTATYPTMIQYIVEKQYEKLSELILNIFEKLIFVILPVTVFCIFFSSDIVHVAFQRGLFDSAATDLTASVFLGYSLGMLFTGLTTILANVYYGFGNTQLNLLFSIIEIVLNIIFNLMLFKPLGVAGLAVATSIAAFGGFCLRVLFLKKFVRVSYLKSTNEILKILLVSLAAAGMPRLIFEYWMIRIVWLRFALTVVLFAVIFLAGALMVKSSTMRSMTNAVMRTMQRKK